MLLATVEILIKQDAGEDLADSIGISAVLYGWPMVIPSRGVRPIEYKGFITLPPVSKSYE